MKIVMKKKPEENLDHIPEYARPHYRLTGRMPVPTKSGKLEKAYYYFKNNPGVMASVRRLIAEGKV